ncbi:MAG: response regulator [Myxococcota bacterium]
MVLADVVMPGLSGYEVCEAIKREPALAHVPVLLLTGTFEAFDEARATQAGANGHITKPFEAQALVQRVTEVMRSAERAPRPAPGAASAATTGTDAGTTAGNAASDDFDFFDNDLTALASPDTTARQTEAACARMRRRASTSRLRSTPTRRSAMDWTPTRSRAATSSATRVRPRPTPSRPSARWPWASPSPARRPEHGRARRRR